jgi:hypothetical protein
MLGCKKEANLEAFEGITETDFTGVIIRDDVTDWNYQDAWNKKEIALFPYDASFDLEGTIKPDNLPQVIQEKSLSGTLLEKMRIDRIIDLNEFYVLPAYPNPTKKNFVFSVHNKTKVGLSYAIVNKDFRVLMRDNIILDMESCALMFDLTKQSQLFSPGQTYRLYYAFSTKEEWLFYKGHGDIRFDK